MTTRDAFKQIARGLATLAMVPMLCSFWVRSRILGRNRALEGSTQLLALVPGLIGQYLRRAFLVHTLRSCHVTATIEFGTIFSQAEAEIGENAYIGPGCHLGWVHIGRDVLLAAGVHVPSGGQTHGIARTDIPIRDQEGQHRAVHIGQGTWIGSAAVVLDDVGRDVIVGAGAVVTAPVADRTVVGGVPARVIKHR